MVMLWASAWLFISKQITHGSIIGRASRNPSSFAPTDYGRVVVAVVVQVVVAVRFIITLKPIPVLRWVNRLVRLRT